MCAILLVLFKCLHLRLVLRLRVKFIALSPLPHPHCTQPSDAPASPGALCGPPGASCGPRGPSRSPGEDCCELRFNRTKSARPLGTYCTLICSDLHRVLDAGALGYSPWGAGVKEPGGMCLNPAVGLALLLINVSAGRGFISLPGLRNSDKSNTR